MMKTCDHMIEAKAVIFCDLGRVFGHECKGCSAWVSDRSPDPHRDQLWQGYSRCGDEAQSQHSSYVEHGRGTGG